jgi:hypothetical protein
MEGKYIRGVRAGFIGFFLEVDLVLVGFVGIVGIVGWFALVGWEGNFGYNWMRLCWGCRWKHSGLECLVISTNSS